ncbi:MAG: hypothetical protein R2818_03590 [Flavobacteriales bacterium]
MLNGNYTLEQTDPTLVPICPLPHPVLDHGEHERNDGQLRQRKYPAAGSARLDHLRGCTTGLCRQYPRLGHEYLSTAIRSGHFLGHRRSALTINSVSPTPTSTNGNTFTWAFPAFNSFQVAPVHVLAEVPVGTALGTVLVHTAEVSNTLPDNNPANDLAIYQRGDRQFRSERQDGSDQHRRHPAKNSISSIRTNGSDYTIRFQNTGTDTAFTVVVTDTLPATLDITSFEMGAASHPFIVSFRTGRVVEWRFPNILSDSNRERGRVMGY